MSAQRATSAVPTCDRSIYPKISGVPWWAAILIAVIATAIGFAIDAGSGNKELTTAFAAAYVAGCVAAVLAVRQSGVFTAVIQPPLLLFCAVPGAYWLFHGAKIGGVKDILINCGYPLIERFPLMVLTSAAVLLIGMIRWYLGFTGGRVGANSDSATDTDVKAADTGNSGLGAKLAAFWSRGATDEADARDPKATRRAHAVRQTPKRARSGSSARSSSTRSGSSARAATRRSTSTRSRQPRDLLDDAAEPNLDRVPRRRPRPVRDVDADAESSALPRRRPRSARDPELRGQPPREIRRDPHTRYGRPSARSSRFDPYEPVEPYELPPRRRPASDAAVKRASSTHHPISQVRYRDAGRSRGAQSSAAESWE